jgi:hypothetical protein
MYNGFQVFNIGQISLLDQGSTGQVPDNIILCMADPLLKY